MANPNFSTANLQLGGVINPEAKTPASDGSGYAGYASAITTTTKVLSGFAETSAFESQLSTQRDADIANVENLTTSYEVTYAKSMDAVNSINSALGDKVSERGLQAMKEQSLLRVAAAETGTTGGTTDFAIQEAFLNENFDNANLVASAEQEVKNIFIGLELEENRVRNSIDSTLLGGGVNVATNSLLAGVQGGVSTGLATFTLLPQSDKTLAFGIKPQEVV